MNQATVTVVVPTYEEFASLPSLIESIEKVRCDSLPNLDLIIVDDNSQDGTEQLITSLHKDWIKLIVRTQDKGLSPSVVAGLHSAVGEYCVVMDADGSHPASAIPAMIHALQEGADFAVGSRYVKGGSTEDGWGVLRWLNSKIATVMARPFTRVLDPMSGFIALSKSTFVQAKELNPVGYKIGLELIVKCQCQNVIEVPIHFSTRQLGESKLTLSVQWQYLQHVIRLLRHTKPALVSFWSFAMVGLSGAGLYLLLLMATSALFTSTPLAIGLAVWLTMTWNFIWDRKYAFWNSRERSIGTQYIGFVLVCSVGVLVNFFVTLSLSKSESMPFAGLIGVSIGSTIGIIFNFLMTRLCVFRK
ncbi:MAG: glycosyltransferase family 2 protein [Phycisphaerales bacterium]|nr:glycosyltransferase family 2 protein [Planctomycetota bacterium]MBL6997245.1 glycosyltransferase family 2 protein [Phycisphaerales bacterium]